MAISTSARSIRRRILTPGAPSAASTTAWASPICCSAIRIAVESITTPRSGPRFPLRPSTRRITGTSHRRLTINIGLRYDIQFGLQGLGLNRGMCFTCVNPITNDPAFQANVAADTPIWNSVGLNPNLSTVYGGVLFAGHNGQPNDAYNTDYTNHRTALRFRLSIESEDSGPRRLRHHVLRGSGRRLHGRGIASRPATRRP